MKKYVFSNIHYCSELIRAYRMSGGYKEIIIAGISLLLGLESEKKNARPLLKNPSRGSGAIE